MISAGLLAELRRVAVEVPGVPDLRIAPTLRSTFGEIDTPDALRAVVRVYLATRDELFGVLARRDADRAFIDKYTADAAARNAGVEYTSPQYDTVIGKKDSTGRVVIGPTECAFGPSDKVRVPPFLQGDQVASRRYAKSHGPADLSLRQVTLFGPPDSAKMCISAMNSVHAQPAGEPSVVSELVDLSQTVPRWGADNEDSKTPILSNLMAASANLIHCFNKTIAFDDAATGKAYRLHTDRLAVPIKRVVGLALPDGAHLFEGYPLPLHLYDFVMHAWHNRHHAEALVFYIPKLESEGDARYVKSLVTATERVLAEENRSYQRGTIKLFIVRPSPFRLCGIVCSHCSSNQSREDAVRTN
jgi:hypothetical protein